MIHVLLGPDYYLTNTEAKRLGAAADPDGLGTIRFDAGTSPTELASAIATPGFFGTPRVVIANNALGKPVGTDKGDRAVVVARQLAEAVYPGNVLILVELGRDSLPKTIRAALGIEVEVFLGAPPRGGELVEWTIRQLERAGSSADTATVRHLLNRLFPGTWSEANRNPLFDVPPDLQLLVSEIAKLVTYAGDTAVTTAIIDTLVQSGVDEQVFALVSAVVRADTRKALNLIADQVADDDDGARFMALIAGNAEMGRIVAESAFDHDLKQTAAELGLTSGRLYNLRKDLANRSADELVANVIDVDRRMKSGITRGPVAQLEDLVLRRRPT